MSGEMRLAADPELRFSQSGTPVASLRLVAASRKKTDNGWEDDRTLWIDGTLFRAQAENAVGSLSKGDLVVVTGKLQTDEWTNQEGQARSKTVLMIDTIGPSLAFRSAQILDGVQAGGQKNAQPVGSTPGPDPQQNAAQSDEPPF